MSTAETITTDQNVSTPAADVSDAAADEALGAVWDKATAVGIEDADEPVSRGADGRFASSKAAPGGAEAAGSGQDGSAASLNAPAAVAAPAHMPSSIKAEWDKIPEPARAAIVQHQTEMDRRFSELGRQMQQSKPIVDRLTEATTKFPQFAGMTPDRLAQGAIELAAVQVELQRNPVGTLVEIAKRFNVLGQLQQAMTGQQVQAADNEVLQRELNQLKGMLAQQPSSIEQAISHELELREINSAVSDFAAAPERAPYWPEVEGTLPQFIEMVKEAQPEADFKSVLEAAYDMAINALPHVRQRVREDEAQRRLRTDPATDRANAAKKAASINVRPSAGKEAPLSEDQAYAAAYDRVMAR